MTGAVTAGQETGCRTVLVLGGTSEARALAADLAAGQACG